MANEGATVSATTLGRTASRGGLAVFSGQGVRILVQVASILILARLLDPADYGVLAMVTAIVGIAEVVRDFGLAPAAIQARTLSDRERSNLFWLNGLIGFALALCVAALAQPIAALYGDPSLALITLCIAPTFAFNGLATQPRAHLGRQMRFFRLTISEVAPQIVALGVAVFLAANGAGYWALVAQQLVQSFLSAVLALSLCGWLPTWWSRTTSVRRFVRYGAGVLGTQLVIFASANVDSVLIGLRFGPGPLGFYNRAFQMLVLPLNQFSSPSTRVALPILSRLESDRASFDRFLLRGQLLVGWVVVPILLFASATSGVLVELLLGANWAPTAELFSILAIGGCFQALSYVTQWVFLATGTTASNLYFALVTRPVMIAIIAGTAFIGPAAVAAGYSASVAIIWVLGTWWITKRVGAPGGALVAQGIRTVTLFGVAAGAVVGVQALVQFANPWITALCCFGVFVLVILLAVGAIRPLRRDFQEIARAARLLARARGTENLR